MYESGEVGPTTSGPTTSAWPLGNTNADDTNRGLLAATAQLGVMTGELQGKGAAARIISACKQSGLAALVGQSTTRSVFTPPHHTIVVPEEMKSPIQID